MFRGDEILLPAKEFRRKAGVGLLLVRSPETEAALKDKLLLPAPFPVPSRLSCLSDARESARRRLQ